MPHHQSRGILLRLGFVAAIGAAIFPLVNATSTPASGVSSVVVHVSGNHLVNGAGTTIQLRGVDLSGSEYACSGDSGTDGWSILDTPSGYTVQEQISEMSTWDINAVRIPLNEDCWLGINGITSAYAGINYVNAISSLVTALNNAGMIAILDLHYNAPSTQVSDSTDGLGGTGQQVMADADHAPAFWESVANEFKSNPGVIFDLYNEPDDVSWSCWKSGGCTAPVTQGTTGGWTIVGMQNLVDDVRAQGADQPIMLGGLNYANDLSQWLTYEPTDTLNPPQLVASVHVYDNGSDPENCDTVSCWNSQIAPVAAYVPVVTGEFGPSTCDGTFVNTYMNWADTEGVSYLAWTWGSVADGWSCADSPALLTSDNGTPDAYGAAVEAHFQAVAAASITTTTTSAVVPSTVSSTTASVQAPQGSSTNSSTLVTISSPVPIVTIIGTSHVVKAGATSLAVSCKVATCVTRVDVAIRAQVKEVVKRHVKIVTRTVVIGSASTSVASGTLKSIVIHFNASGVTALAASRNHRLSATMSASVLHGATTVSTLTLFS